MAILLKPQVQLLHGAPLPLSHPKLYRRQTCDPILASAYQAKCANTCVNKRVIEEGIRGIPASKHKFGPDGNWYAVFRSHRVRDALLLRMYSDTSRTAQQFTFRSELDSSPKVEVNLWLATFIVSTLTREAANWKGTTLWQAKAAQETDVGKISRARKQFFP
jgi:hypothetical protein